MGKKGKNMATIGKLCLRSTIHRNQLVLTSRLLATSASRMKKEGKILPNPFKNLPTDVEHAGGLEKWELLAKEAGNDDPFAMKQQVRGKGTKDDPNIVKSLAGEYRMVGCQCGYWFKLEPIQNGPEVGHLPA